METILIKALQLMMALAILVTIHEFGHYIFARIFGVKVEKFYLFFNPWFSLFKYKPKKKDDDQNNGRASWRDTEYGIGWLPLGGYVKIAGMIDESMDKEQMKQPAKSWEFRSKPAYQRLLIMTAGVIFNFILAIVIYAGIVYSYGEQYIPFKNATYGMKYSESAHKIGFIDGDIPLFADGQALETRGEDVMKMLSASNVKVLRNGTDTVSINIPENFIFEVEKDARNDIEFIEYRFPVIITNLTDGYGAAKAGLEKGDHIVSINGISTPTFDIFKTQLSSNASKAVTVEYLRNGQKGTAQVEIDADAKMGIIPAHETEIYKTVTKNYNIFESIPRGIELGVSTLTSYVSQLKLIFTPQGAQSIGGFGSLGSIFPEQWSWLSFWSITAFFSVILAFMNILPIPALDGGHVLFLLYEMVTRRQPNEKFLEYAQMVGMAFLLLLLVYANGNDIYRFFFK